MLCHQEARGGLPPIVAALRAIGESDLSGSECDMLRTLLTWANPKTWELYPTIRTIAKYAKRDARTIQRVLGKLEERGVLTFVERSRGGIDPHGRGRGHRLRLNLDCPRRVPTTALNPGTSPELNPDTRPGLIIRYDEHEARLSCAQTPAPKHPYPGTPPDKQSREPAKEPTTNTDAAAVALILGSGEMVKHANATPQRLAWIAREAPGKTNPAGWAAEAIRKAWQPPPPKEDAREARRRERALMLANFNRLDEGPKAAVVAAVRRRFPNLSPRPDDDPVVRAAIARVMTEGTDSTIENP